MCGMSLELFLFLYRCMLMTQTYPRTDREKLDLIARAAFERTQPRHQASLERLRLLATLF